MAIVFYFSPNRHEQELARLLLDLEGASTHVVGIEGLESLEILAQYRPVGITAKLPQKGLFYKIKWQGWIGRRSLMITLPPFIRERNTFDLTIVSQKSLPRIHNLKVVGRKLGKSDHRYIFFGAGGNVTRKPQNSGRKWQTWKMDHKVQKSQETD